LLGKVRLLDRDKIEPGETTWAQILLTQPIAAVKDDRFIIRSPQETLGGGQIVGSRAKRHRRFRPDVIEGLVARESGTAEHIILAVIQEEEPVELEKLIALCNLPRGEAEAAITMLSNQKKVVILGEMELLFSAQGWENLEKQSRLAVQKYHQQFPLRHGPSKEELRGKLKTPAKLFPYVLEQLIRDGALIDAGPMVRLPEHTPQPTTKQQAEAEAFLGRLAHNPYLPSLDPIPEPDLLNLLIEQHSVVKVSDDVIFLTSTYDKMIQEIITHIKSHGKVTVAEVRDLFHTSRKYALALMEYLDAQKITRRIGDERVLR
jgi:selenocysteine-specific elongation factor